MYQHYSEHFKLKLVNLYSTGTTINILCKKYSVPRSTIYSWIHKYRKIWVGKDHLISARELYLLRKRLNTITVENNIFRESNCSKASSLDDKITAIKKLDGKYSIHSLCRVLGVRRSTYYHRKFRSPKQTIIEKKNALLMPEIKTIFDETKGRLGARKINVLLAQKGIRTSAGRVSNLMKRMNLESVYKRKSIRYNFIPSTKPTKDVINRSFKQTEPNKVWVSDITYICKLQTLLLMHHNRFIF